MSAFRVYALHVGVIAALFALQFALPAYHAGNVTRIMLYAVFAIGYNISTSVFGGTSAVVIGSLINVFHTNYIPAFYLVIAGLIALVPILLIPETAGVSIRSIKTPKPAGHRLAPASD